jgi:hypothetical protein
VSESDALIERVFARVVSRLARPLTERESDALGAACDLAMMGGPTERACLEEYVVARALELAP